MEFSCEQIGLSKEELQTRIVDSIVERMLTKYVTYSDESGNYDDIENSELRNRLDKAIKNHIDTEIDRVATAYLGEVVPNLVEKFRLQETNGWGEKRGESMSFTEYLVKRADMYMAEPVDLNGKTKKESGGYSRWSADSTRMTYAIEKYIHIHMQQAMKAAIGGANKTLAESIIETVRLSMNSVLSTLKVEVKN